MEMQADFARQVAYGCTKSEECAACAFLIYENLHWATPTHTTHR